VKVCAIIPFRPRDEDRIANLARTRQQYEALGWEVAISDHDGDPFSRSRAINQAAAFEVADADVLFIADCDILIPDLSQLLESSRLALEGDRYVVSFSHLRVLDWPGTEKVRAGFPPDPAHEIESVSLIWGCAFAISRTLFDRVCGFDERFVGWGAEDIGFLVSASTMGGDKQRVYGEAWHLAHPTNEERDNLGENNALASRYRGCDGDPECMRMILAERGCEA